MAGFFEEFRKFATRGNVVDLAVGVILGAAFNKIVTSLVDDLMMPPLGLIIGRVKFDNLYISLTGQHIDSLAAAKAAGVPTLNYGQFINTVVQFLIVAFALFVLIKWVNRLAPPAEEKPPAAPSKECPYCASTIALKAVRCPQCTSELPADVPAASA